MKSEIDQRRAHPAGAAFSSFAAPDGWALRRMDWPQPDPSKARGSLLFANGRGDFIEKYLEALAHWHARGWNVAGFDWRGQGGSSGTIVGGNIELFDPLVADLEALVEDWRSANPGPHVLVGHSMGGHLVLRYLAERAPPIDAAVLVAPMIGVQSGKLPKRLGGFIAGAMKGVGLGARRLWKQSPGRSGRFRQAFLTSCAERYQDELWWKERNPAFDLGPPSWGWLAAAFRSARALAPDRLRRVETPVLLLGTDRDRLVDPLAIRRAAAVLPVAELHMFADAAHEILRESDGVRVAALSRIDDFLDRRAPA